MPLTEIWTAPERYQPRLKTWSHIWRFALMVAISAAVWAVVGPEMWRDHRPLAVVDLALGVASFVLVGFRRRAPVPIAVVISLLTAVSAIAAGPAVLATVSVATRRVVWELVLVATLSLLAAQAFSVIGPDSGNSYWLDLALNTAFIVSTLAWGMYIGSRRELVWNLRAQVAHASEEQELRAEKARGAERARIAREMHDVLAHRISQVSMQAGALAFREDLSAESMRTHASEIQTRANAALDDLRAVLGVLRDDESGELLHKPQPTYTDLPELLDGARQAGMRLSFEERIDGEVPTVIGRAIYRIVQEGITNAYKHARETTVTVTVEGGPGTGLDVMVRNPLGFGPPSAPGSGLGLVGLVERAELTGGNLSHRVEGSMFVLRAWIPWTP